MSGEDVSKRDDESDEDVERYERTTSLSYVGPLPPASEFERYEAVAPGAGKAILELADNSSRRAHEAQLDSNRTARHITWSVVVIVGIVAVVVLVVSLALIDAGAETLGAVGSITGAVFIGLGVLSQWIHARRTERANSA